MQRFGAFPWKFHQPFQLKIRLILHFTERFTLCYNEHRQEASYGERIIQELLQK